MHPKLPRQQLLAEWAFFWPHRHEPVWCKGTDHGPLCGGPEMPGASEQVISPLGFARMSMDKWMINAMGCFCLSSFVLDSNLIGHVIAHPSLSAGQMQAPSVKWLSKASLLYLTQTHTKILQGTGVCITAPHCQQVLLQSLLKERLFYSCVLPSLSDS